MTNIPTVIPTVDEAFARLDMPMREAMMTQRAVRRVLPDEVDDAIVRKCIELALRAPTGSNGQNWEFVVVKDRAVKEKLAARYRQAWSVALATQYRPWTIGRGLRRELVTTDDPMAKLLRAVQWQVDHFAEIPVLVVPCLGGGPRAGIVPYVPAPHVLATGVAGSIYPSVQNLLLAARAMGLGANLITLPLWSVTSARRILGLPASVTPYCVIPLGWPRGRYGPTTRKPVEEVVHLDGYGNRAWLDG
ncbi:nitroreductase family protein [Mycolicibacterium komossense]|uniref:Nitroreductase family protein n=1 Tax=Mycolicibacterium komossense TaxID=1779 RepID=A0ABT3CL02_9MYCO|nr:nitroreductase family protein [Mycolicibacterium komossense]MCV7230140.1 nitroreductase family protein [Mycolicibacterium komossense]